jgi:hypothetical protein
MYPPDLTASVRRERLGFRRLCRAVWVMAGAAALPIKSAIEMMQDERGRHFDPELLDAFFLALREIEAIRHTYSD